MRGCAPVEAKLANHMRAPETQVPVMKALGSSKANASRHQTSPYAAASCVLLLLLAGMMVKFGPALQLFHVQN